MWGKCGAVTWLGVGKGICLATARLRCQVLGARSQLCLQLGEVTGWSPPAGNSGDVSGQSPLQLFAGQAQVYSKRRPWGPDGGLKCQRTVRHNT